MIFHLPGNDCSVTGSNADTPFSSWRLNPGLTPTTLNEVIFWPTVFIVAPWVEHEPVENDSHVMSGSLINQFNCYYPIGKLGLSRCGDDAALHVAAVWRCA